MQQRKYLIFYLVVFLPAKIFAQDITGLWKGTLYNDTTQQYYKYEIGISEEKGKLTGFSHTWFILDEKQYYGVKKVKIKKAQDGKIIIEDAGLIANNYPVAPSKNVRQLNVLTLDMKDSIMTLSGPFSTNRTKEYHHLTGYVNLQRKNDFWQSALVPHLQELGLEDELSFVKKQHDLARIETEHRSTQESITLKHNIRVAGNETHTPSGGDTTSKVDQEIAASGIKRPEVSTELISEKTKANEADAGIPTKGRASARQDKELKSSDKDLIDATPGKGTTKILQQDQRDAMVRVNEPVIERPVPIPAKPAVPAAEVLNRTNVVQQTVYFTSDSLQLSLYDNGEVDGDTVSVLMNGQVIMAKERLSTHAVRKTIYAGHDTDSLELLMYAENLGTIAPNTGLLVVQDGKRTYEIRFSGDLKKNASIIFRRKKD